MAIPLSLSIGVGAWLRVLILAFCLPLGQAIAGVGLSIAVDDIQGDDWRVSGITLILSSDRAGNMAVDIAAETVELPEKQGNLHDVRLLCGELRVNDDGWQCDQGQLVGGKTPWGEQDSKWSGHWKTDGGARLDIDRLNVAGGNLGVVVTADGNGWRAGMSAYRLQVPRLAGLATIDLPKDWGIKGRASGQLELRGEGAQASRATADLAVDQFNYASPDGAHAAEGVLLKLEASGRPRGNAWQFDGKLRWPRGAVYAEPLFLDASEFPLTVDASGRFRPGENRLQFDSWSVDLSKTFHVSGTGELDAGDFSIRDLTVAAHSDDAGRLYQLLAQPFLLGTPADDMLVKGRLGFVLHFDRQGIEQAGLELNGLTLDDRRGRFSLLKTDGSVAWDRSKAVPVSKLTTEGVTLLRIRSDEFAIKAHFAADRVNLVEPVVVPVLGGQIALDSFSLTGALVAGAKPSWTASASVRGVSLAQLTRELEWPPFTGALSGDLKEMRYQDQEFSIGGGLRVQAFDGTIRVSDLRIREPLSNVPELFADARMRGLNLEALTRTFAFGRIEGRLDGDVNGLRLVAWQPSRFDLHLYTPTDDDSRRRISQRAVENLTELGSGIPGGLSTGILRIFEEFSYAAIDLKIQLDGNVATLDGLARPDGGYYLVRGSGLPRIDVIGRNRSVAWKDLLERLRQIRVESVQVN